MPSITSPENKKKYTIVASEVLYDPLDGETPTAENFGAPGKPGDAGLRNALNHQLTNKVTEYDSIELYGVDDDYNQMHAKILNPKVGSFIAMGAPIIGSNYIFFKAAVYELQEQNIIVHKCGTDTWTQNSTAVSEKNGGHNEFMGLWGPHMNIGAFKATDYQTDNTKRGGAADFSLRRIGLFKVIGYKNVTVTID